MRAVDLQTVVVTGIGMVTPLGNDPQEVLGRIQRGDSVAAAPSGFDPSMFACPVCAQVRGFEPQRYVSEAKLVRLMNRDAQLAVAAARLALEDAGVKPGATYQPEEIGLYGATGLAGLPLAEVAPLIRASAGLDGSFDLRCFGQAGLKAVSPILSFKILSNMPLCFVSINENIQGPNAVYTPWEGQGAQAVEAGIRALLAGDARCALVGACDVKTHELAFVSLQQHGLFDEWREIGRKRGDGEHTPGVPASLPAGLARNRPPRGVVPAEGSAFLVLEAEQDARARGAHIYARLVRFRFRTFSRGISLSQARSDALSSLDLEDDVGAVVCSANGSDSSEQEENRVLMAARISAGITISPKRHVGNLFAAAALLQISLGALLAERYGKRVLANCFGHGREQAAFVLDRA